MYEPAEHWPALVRRYGDADPLGFAPVLHPGAPPGFNRSVDETQWRAWKRAITLVGPRAGATALDVGCGTGRWLRRFANDGFLSIGVDRTKNMLRLAAKMGTNCPLVAGDLSHLPFAGESFDVVSSVTVVQHVVPAHQQRAINELTRVLRQGGHLLLFELIRGSGPHIFPRPAQEWIELVSATGMVSVCWFGEEFWLFDRLFVSLAQRLRGANGSTAETLQPPPFPPSESLHAGLRRAYWTIRRFTAAVSAWSEPVAAAVCPERFATHGVFVFRKSSARGSQCESGRWPEARHRR